MKEYKLTRLNDGLVKEADDIKYFSFGDDNRANGAYDSPDVGRSLMLDPHPFSFTWHTTLITEIIEESPNRVEFKTKNSHYILERHA